MQQGPIGHTLDLRFDVEEYLGGGSMADVFRGRDLHTGEPVAIKVLRPAMAQSYELVERFRREAEALALLGHPRIVQQIAAGQDGDYVYIAMQYIEGGSLADEMAAHDGPMPLDRVLRVADDVCGALSYAHAQGVVHRDIKPGNILIDASTGDAILTDFGIAKVADAVTMTQFAIGTPAYMSPEQCRGIEVDGRSDIYAFACVLYEMLAGVKPFRGDASRYETGSSHAIVAEQMSQLAQPIRLFNPDLKPEVELVVAKALAKAPAQRHADASLVAQELRTAASASAWRALRIAAPAGAEVRVDGVFAGAGDLTLSALADGDHDIEVTLPGHHAWSQRVAVPQVEAIFPALRADPEAAAAPLAEQIAVAAATAAMTTGAAPPSARPPSTPAPSGQVRGTAYTEDVSANHRYDAATVAPLAAEQEEVGPFEPGDHTMVIPLSADEDTTWAPPPAVDGPHPVPEREYALRDWFSTPTPQRPVATRRDSSRRRIAVAAAGVLLLAAVGFGGAGAYLYVTRDDAAAQNDPDNSVASASTETPIPSPTQAPPSPTPTVIATPPAPITPTSAQIIGEPCVYQRTEARIADRTVVQCILPGKRVRIDPARGTQFGAGHLWWWTVAEDGRQGWMSNEFIVVSARNTPVNVSDNANGSVLIVESVDLQPDHSIVVHIGFRNETGAAIPWKVDRPGDSSIYLTDNVGRASVTAAVGGSLAAEFPGGLLPGATESGWHRFVLANPSYAGPLTLHYPGHNAITFTIP